MTMSNTQPSEREVDDLIAYLRSLDADKLRRVIEQPAPRPRFCFMQTEKPDVDHQPPVREVFGTPLFAVLPPVA